MTYFYRFNGNELINIELFSISSLIPALQESNRHKDAAEIVREFKNDSALAIKHFCDGKHYGEAIYEAKNSNELLGISETLLFTNLHYGTN